MPQVSLVQVIFLAYNLAVGMAVGAAAARLPAFASLGMPTFFWLFAALFAFEILAGLLMKAHPSTLLTMPWRFAGLMVSLLACYAAQGVLTAH